jgi:hypothetical protein
MVRFLRTPKGLLLVILLGLLAIASPKLGTNVTSRVVVAGVTAAALDVPLTYWRRGKWMLPDGAVLTGIIVAFILRPEESWRILVVTVAVAILSKHALRTHWSNILNPAALALVVAAIVLQTGQNWWGALPDLGIAGAVVVLVAGAFIAERINKLPMVLAFFGAYFTLFTVASFFRSAAVAETFLTPDIQATLFFAFFMLDDPPTSPVRYEDQIVFGVIVATVAYFVFMQFGGVYFLPAGLLAGNLWESGRRLVVDHMRTRGLATAGAREVRRLQVAGSIGTALLVLPLVFASGIIATGGPPAASSAVTLPASGPSPTGTGATVLAPSAVPGTPNPYPFVPSFDNDFNGTYQQTNDAASAHLVLDGVATGAFSLGVHVELQQMSVVPTPDDESIESTPDDEALEARPVVTTTINKAQLVDPASKGLLCDGKLTALSEGTMRFSCDGTAAYVGVQMQIGSELNAANDGTFSGTLSGTMQRTS